MEWLASRPQLRPLVLAVLAVVLLLGGTAWLARSGGGGSSSNPSQHSAGPVATQRPTEAPTATQAPVGVVGSSQGVTDPGPAQATAGVAEVAAFNEAKPVASSFIAADLGYRWDDTPAVLRARVRPFDTDAYDAGLAASAGRLGAADIAKRHENATATVLEINPQQFDAQGRLAVAAWVKLDLVSDGRKSSRNTSVEVWLVKTPAGWRVDEVRL